MRNKLKEMGLKLLSTVFGIAVVVLFIYLGMKWQTSNNEKLPWIGSLYKIENSERSLRESDRFETLDACRSWSQNKIEDQADAEWDYECGTDCKYSDQSIIGGKRVKSYTCSRVEE